MDYGLDIGPGEIRAITDAGDGPTIESVPPVVVPVDDAALSTGDSRSRGQRST
ncbi:hypothetical protein [Natrinema sp. SYSU A 869]|uniref:hypothetical protein n=1 Tax=Natrinema sp. SYSU A 869 TaxID=2871694 RepID=UPI0021030B78|nr:hypothetical protein [Natrinema sp. SYSU A 869]